MNIFFPAFLLALLKIKKERHKIIPQKSMVKY